MRRLLAVVSLGLVVGVALADKPAATGHVSDAGRYSVVFPGKPPKADDDKRVATAGGNLSVVTSRVEAGKAVYSVTFTDYPESFKELDPARVLEGVAVGMKGGEGTLGDEAAVDFDGVTGKAFTVAAGDNLVRAKVVLVGRRLYIVQVSGQKDAVRGKAADEFLTSFHIKK